jgi:predicted RNase H-like HicB family nuclease
MNKRKNNNYTFTVVFEKEKDGGYHVFCPALPGCHSQGDSYDEAVSNIHDAMKLYIESLKAHREKIPEEDISIKPVRVAV